MESDKLLVPSFIVDVHALAKAVSGILSVQASEQLNRIVGW